MDMPTIDQVSEKIRGVIEAPGSGFKQVSTAGRSQTRDGEGEVGVRLDRYSNGEIEVSVIVEKPKHGVPH